jgi:hypothetical protein
LEGFIKITSAFTLPRDLRALARELKYRPPWVISCPKLLLETLLTEKWRYYPTQYEVPSNPQIFARLVRQAGFEGILYPSSKNPKKKCLAVFPENLQSSDSFIELKDKPPNSVKHKRLDCETYEVVQKS